MREHVHFVEVDLLVHVVAGDKVGFDGWQAPSLDEHATVVADTKGTNHTGAVKATDLCTGVGLVTNHVVHAVHIELAAHDFFHEARDGLTVVLVMTVHQRKETSQSLLAKNLTNRFPDGCVIGLEDVAPPGLV